MLMSQRPPKGLWPAILVFYTLLLSQLPKPSGFKNKKFRDQRTTDFAEILPRRMKVMNWCKTLISHIPDKQVRDPITPCLQIRRVVLRRIQTCKLNSSFMQQVNDYDSQMSRKSVFGYHSAINTSHVVTLQGMYFDISKT